MVGRIRRGVQHEENLKKLNKLSRTGKISPSERLREREQILVKNLIRDYGKGYVVAK